MPTLSDSATGLKDSTPERAASDWPPAVIAGGYQTGVLGMRSLIRRGVRASCFDCHPEYPAFRSVYGEAHLCPDPDILPERWMQFMVGLAQKTGGKPVLIPSADQFVSAIAAHAETLAQHYVLSPGIRLQGLLANKQSQYALAAEHEMPLPTSRLVKLETDLMEFTREAHYPCLLKPLHFREWQAFPEGHPLSFQKVAIARNPEELLGFWRMAATINPITIAQEIIEGPDTAKRVYVACYDQGHRRIASAMFRELRCDPLGFGPATVSEPVTDPETDAVCDGWLRRMEYVGICEIEAKWDTRDGRVKLIEANPRLTGGGDAAPYAGVDVAWLHYLDLIGKPVTPVTADGRDFRHIVLRSDGRAIVGYLKAGLVSWGDIFRSYKPPLAFYDFDLRDWRYSAATLYLMVRAGAAALVRALWPGRGR
jgi:predicted ATP-grasp superfamily ATP-dependent carboligase